MIRAGDPLNAFLDYPEAPVSNAELGPLSGLTLAVKDIFDVAAYPSGWGNPVRLSEAKPATRSNSAVRTMLDSGARFVGKTQTEELAFSMIGQNVHFPHPVNPAAPDRVTGGSSSGSAAAVAGELVDIATGSDTGGSVRCPASFCGLIGLRTTHGAIALDHTMPLASSFDTFGWFARDMEIYRKVAEVVLENAPHPYPLPVKDGQRGASTSAAPSPRPSRGEGKGEGHLSHPLSIPALDALVTPRCAAEYRRMRDHVASIVGKPANAPAPLQTLDELYWTTRKLQAREAWDAHGKWIESSDRKLGEATYDRFAFGKGVSDADMRAETVRRADFTRWLGDLLGDDGFIVMPTVTDIAPRSDAAADEFSVFREASIRLLCWSGLSGFPQLTLPLGAVDGAPFGISLLGPAGSDLALLDLGAKVMGGRS
jgi:amidase